MQPQTQPSLASPPVPDSCAGTPDFAETFAYGADARPSSMSTAIRADFLAKTYQHRFTYDAAGRMVADMRRLASAGDRRIFLGRQTFGPGVREVLWLYAR